MHAGQILFGQLYQQNAQVTSSVVPAYWATPIKDQPLIRPDLISIEYYLIVPLKRGLHYYKDTFSLKKGRSYKKGSTIIFYLN